MNIESLYQKYKLTGKVSTDTRQITPGSVFFALRGDKFNANEFANEALTKGASFAVVDEERFATSDRHILVNDSLEALQQLARFHRSQLSIPVIGLTGSNGKTTSKELVSAVLNKKYKTFATKGNLNNHIGVPLSILSIGPEYEMAVIEMGANHVGEIALLSSIANPTHGFITNIGKAHIGTFGGFENIIRGKSELYQHLIHQAGTVFINSQNPILFAMAKRFKEPVLYPAKGDYYHCELISFDPTLVIRTERGSEVKTQLIGSYNFENIAVALTIGKFFGVKPEEAEAAVAGYVPENMRSQVIKKGTNVLLLDAYNANPSSMLAAIESLAAMKAPHKIAVVGDMFELEEEAEKEHRAIGEVLRQQKFYRVYLCGKLMQAAHGAYPEARYFETREALIEDLKKEPITHSTVLIKASRGMGLEKIIDVL